MKIRSSIMKFIPICSVILVFSLSIGTAEAADKSHDQTAYTYVKGKNRTSAAGTQVRLNKEELILTVGQKAKLKLKGAGDNIKWHSSDKSVATVSAKGKVRAQNAGKASITARYKGKKYVCIITVMDEHMDVASPVQENNLSIYLKATSNCQVNNANIGSVVDSVIRGLGTPEQKAKAIFNYVRDNIDYTFYYNTQKGAVGTLNSKSGNCNDIAHLLVAMLRRAGIYARYCCGVCTFVDGSVLDHVWVECTWDENTWYTLDACDARNEPDVIVSWNFGTGNYQLKGRYASLPE